LLPSVDTDFLEHQRRPRSVRRQDKLHNRKLGSLGQNLSAARCERRDPPLEPLLSSWSSTSRQGRCPGLTLGAVTLPFKLVAASLRVLFPVGVASLPKVRYRSDLTCFRDLQRLPTSRLCFLRRILPDRRQGATAQRLTLSYGQGRPLLASNLAENHLLKLNTLPSHWHCHSLFHAPKVATGILTVIFGWTPDSHQFSLWC